MQYIFIMYSLILYFIFTSIQMMIINNVKCNNYSSYIIMEIFQKTFNLFGELLDYLFKTWWVITRPKLMIFHFEMLIEVMYSFIFIFKCIYMTIHKHEKYWILSWIENLQTCYLGMITYAMCHFIINLNT